MMKTTAATSLENLENATLNKESLWFPLLCSWNTKGLSGALRTVIEIHSFLENTNTNRNY